MRCRKGDGARKTHPLPISQVRHPKSLKLPIASCPVSENNICKHIYRYIKQKVAPMVSARVFSSLVALSLHGAGAFHVPVLPSARASAIRRTTTGISHVSSMSASQDKDSKSFYPFQRSALTTRYVCVSTWCFPCRAVVGLSKLAACIASTPILSPCPKHSSQHSTSDEHVSLPRCPKAAQRPIIRILQVYL